MILIRCTDETVILRTHKIEDPLDLSSYLINKLSGGLADSRCLLLYLDTVLIGTGLEAHVKALELLVSCDTVGEDDLVGVSDVRLARSVGDGRCDVIRFLFHISFPPL